jgi:signal transduction histidine kinase
LVISNDCDENLLLETDAEFVVQILTNLVENACKYSADAPDPRIWLSARPSEGGAVTFEVDDAGEGVLPHDRKAIFRPFRRSGADAAARPGNIGLGLGLALSRYWASCLGGSLVLKRSPRNQMRYSCFSLRVPGAKPT